MKQILASKGYHDDEIKSALMQLFFYEDHDVFIEGLRGLVNRTNSRRSRVWDVYMHVCSWESADVDQWESADDDEWDHDEYGL